MLDIHCHILPGVDDGSGNMNDSVEMAQLAAESGTTGIVATPHCNIPGEFDNYWNDEMQGKLQALRGILKGKNIPVEIYRGQEIFLSNHFETHIENRDFVTLNNSEYMLVELDFRIDEVSAVSRLGRLASYGYTPILAHPERYGFVIENPSTINKIHASGVLIQLNSSSVMGDFGARIKRTANLILRDGLADFVASDAHSQYSRTPSLADTHEYICGEFSYDYADILFNINPLKVINNEKI